MENVYIVVVLIIIGYLQSKILDVYECWLLPWKRREPNKSSIKIKINKNKKN